MFILFHAEYQPLPLLARVRALLWRFKKRKLGKSKTIWIQILIKTDSQWVCVTCKQCAFLNRALMVGWCGNMDYVWFYGSYTEQFRNVDDLTLKEKTICRVKAGYCFLTEYRLRCYFPLVLVWLFSDEGLKPDRPINQPKRSGKYSARPFKDTFNKTNKWMQQQASHSPLIQTAGNI